MVYIITLASDDLDGIRGRLEVEGRLTKANLSSRAAGLTGLGEGGRLVLLLSDNGREGNGRYLEYLGVAARRNTVGPVDSSITVDPIRRAAYRIPLDGEFGILSKFPAELKEEVDQNSSTGLVGICGNAVWEAFSSALREHPLLVPLLDWLIAQANPLTFDIADAADRSWQEQKDAVRSALRIAGFPLSLDTWRRPASRDAPYLAGLIPEPVENSLIDHDVRVADVAFGMASEWMNELGTRCDIHVLKSSDERRLEIVNVNATPVEGRLGTDMIYYHVPTESFVLVQYKRLDRNRKISVDDRLLGQLIQLEKVEELSRGPVTPEEWRLGKDSCFLKLAHWRQGVDGSFNELVPGMYLPVSYVRLLLEDDRTLGSRKKSSRALGYGIVDRYLVSSQFVELVKHGMVGTVGVSREDLKKVVRERKESGHSVVAAFEKSQESPGERQSRARKRSRGEETYSHHKY